MVHGTPNELSIELAGFRSRGEYSANIGRVENARKVVRLRVANARIARALDFARREHVPKRNVVTQQHVALFLDGSRRWLVENRGEHTPEAVLWVPVVKTLFARCGRGHSAQQQHAAAAIEHGLDFMGDGCCVHCGPFARVISFVDIIRLEALLGHARVESTKGRHRLCRKRIIP